MAKEKTVNYSASMTEALTDAYSVCENDAARKACILTFADDFGKTPASIRQKLVREGVYQKNEKTTKAGTRVESKADIVADIARALGVDSDIVGSLEKATKGALNLVRGTLAGAEILLADKETAKSE